MTKPSVSMIDTTSNLKAECSLDGWARASMGRDNALKGGTSSLGISRICLSSDQI